MKKFLYLPDRLLARRADLGLLTLRIAVGVIFAAHGASKLFDKGVGNVAKGFDGLGIPLPAISAYLATFTEFAGGLMVIAGVLTRWISVPLAFTMVVAFLFVHKDGGFFLPKGAEYVFFLFLTTVSLLFTGAGRYSVDALLMKKCGACKAD
ncbi:MAG: putative oxidoreductase [Candidatus Sumerlaeota bacterium]|nr:putative oxidoreductase [Candidatus Sumerlaeota bacterium]